MMELVFDFFSSRKDFSESLKKDFLWLIGKEICEKIKPLENDSNQEEDWSVSMVMQSDLLSGGLQTNLFGAFSENQLNQMEADASIGGLDDVLEHIINAKKTLKAGGLKDSYNEQDIKWLDII